MPKLNKTTVMMVAGVLVSVLQNVGWMPTAVNMTNTPATASPCPAVDQMDAGVVGH